MQVQAPIRVVSALKVVQQLGLWNHSDLQRAGGRQYLYLYQHQYQYLLVHHQLHLQAIIKVEQEITMEQKITMALSVTTHHRLELLMPHHC